MITDFQIELISKGMDKMESDYEKDVMLNSWAKRYVDSHLKLSNRRLKVIMKLLKEKLGE